MPVTTRSGNSKKSNAEGSESPEELLGDTTTLPTLFDVIKLKKFNSQRIKSMKEISAITDKVYNIESTFSSRIANIGQVVERITKEPATVKAENLTTDNKKRNPFSVPGLQSTWNPDRVRLI